MFNLKQEEDFVCWIQHPFEVNLKTSKFYERRIRACLYGLGYQRQPSFPMDTQRLHENCVTEKKVTVLNYTYILRQLLKKISIIICPSFFLVLFY